MLARVSERLRAAQRAPIGTRGGDATGADARTCMWRGQTASVEGSLHGRTADGNVLGHERAATLVPGCSKYISAGAASCEVGNAPGEVGTACHMGEEPTSYMRLELGRFSPWFWVRNPSSRCGSTTR